MANPIPDGYTSITPYLLVSDVDAPLGFLQAAFGATIIRTNKLPSGESMHAEIEIGNGRAMFGLARGDFSPTPSGLYLYVENVDAVYAQAIAAGGTSLYAPVDMFYGDRSGGVLDPAGNSWWIATHIEDLSPEELAERTAKQCGCA